MADPRQALRDATLFPNASFTQVGDGGAPLGWACGCFWPDGGSAMDTGCEVVSDPSASTGRALEVQSSCYAWTDAAPDPDAGLRFDYFAEGAMGAAAGYLVGYLPNNSPSGAYLQSDAPLLGDGGWAELPSLDALNTSGLTRVRMIFAGGLSAPTRFADLIAVQDIANPTPPIGALLLGVGREGFSYAQGSSPASFYVPLPLDWASQVPLDVELQVSRASAVAAIGYTVDRAGNFGAEVTLLPDAGAPDLQVAWDAVVLTRYIDPAERPQVYAEPADAGPWLTATPVVNSADPAIQSVAAQLNAGGDAEAQMAAVVGWTSSHITYGVGPSFDLSASGTLHDLTGTCTGFANLASALGRALGVPTVSLADILVGEPQQIHSINEFYLGPTKGWRRVEPQGTATSVPEDYALPIRRVLPEDESSAALSQTRWAVPGVPLNTITELNDPGSRLSPAPSAEQFIGCPECLTGAKVMRHLSGDPARLQSLFTQARSAWEVDLAALQAGQLDAARAQARRAFRDARSLDDLANDLSALPP